MRSLRQCIRALLKHLRVSSWAAVSMVLLGLIDVAATLSFVYLSKSLVDIVTGAQAGSLTRHAIFLSLAMFIQILCRVGSNYCQGASAIKSANTIRERLFSKVLRARHALPSHSGDTVSRLEEDIRVVSDFTTSSFPQFVVTVIQLLAASVFLFVMQPGMAWILLLIMPVAVLGSRLFFNKMRRLSVEIRSGQAEVQAMVQENIQHRDLVKSMCCESSLETRLSEKHGYVRSKVYNRLNYNAISRFFMHLGFAGGYAFVFIWAVCGIQEGSVSYGMMVAFLQLVGQVQRPVAEMARHIPAFIRALSSEERLLDLEELEQEKVTENQLFDSVPGLKAQGLCFSYDGGAADVFTDFSFDFKPGTITAILGHTGVGKSTLVKLMMALVEPKRGEVLLYDCSGKQLKVSPSTRCNFMYVPQGNTLMSGTIRENLLSFAPNATEDEMLDVLTVSAAEFVLDLPNGLDTICSERGGGLSEGQAQRIAIARALLRPGGVLVLDESTSSLDPETERQMLSHIVQRYHGQKTIICITHRDLTASVSDNILNLDAIPA